MNILPKTILLVEDEAIIAFSEKKLLSSRGYIVHHAFTGEKAIEAALDPGAPYDLILMDIDLGIRMDGTQAADIILKEKDIPIVFLSSHTEPDIVERTEKITSYGYVVKNSGITVLDASIKMAFKLFEARIKEKEKEERLAKFMESASDAFCLLDSNLNFIDLNRRALNILVKDEGDIIGRSIADIISGVKESGLYNRYMEVISTGESYETESSMEHPVKGKIHHIIKSFRVGEGLGIIMHDITERKLIEDALRESEEKHRSFIEQTSEGVAIIDEEGRLIEWNNANERISGISREKILGMYYWDMMMLFIPPEKKTEERRKELAAVIRNSLKTGEPVFKNYSEYELVNVAGERRITRQSIFPIKTLKGYRFGSLSNDITDHRNNKS